MAERFERLYSLRDNLYSAGSPVIVSAGALLKDNQSGKVLAQIKYQNVSGATIKALKVSLKALDISGKEVAGVNEYQYLDLNVKNGESFGGDKAILLPDSVTRKIEISAITVVLVSGASVAVTMPLSWLPVGKKLGNVLDSQGLVDQYRLETNNSAEYVPQKAEGLWQCACGCWNGTGTCTECHGSEKQIFGAYDVQKLSEKLAVRLAKEQAEREEKERKEEEERKEREEKARVAAEEAAARQKKTKKTLTVVSSVIAAVVIIAVLAVFVIIPNMKYNAAMKLLEAGRYEEAAVEFEALGNYRDAEDISSDSEMYGRYAEAAKLFSEGNYLQAASAFEALGAFNDAPERAQESKYCYAESLLACGEYLESAAVFEALNGYKDSKERVSEAYKAQYDFAKALMDAGKYTEAISAFMVLNGYEDSIDQIENCYIGIYGEQVWNRIKEYDVGSTYVLGSYEQDNNITNGKEDIEWLVLAKDGSKILIISKYALEHQEYSPTFNNVTWESCTLRRWLNNGFLNEAFSNTEREQIVTTTLQPRYGNTTQDKVFLLNISEARLYFSSDKARQCRYTEYAAAQGGFVSDDGYCNWWLLSPGNHQDDGAIVWPAGDIYEGGAHMTGGSRAGVRPVMWIDLNY